MLPQSETQGLNHCQQHTSVDWSHEGHTRGGFQHSSLVSFKGVHYLLSTLGQVIYYQIGEDLMNQSFDRIKVGDACVPLPCQDTERMVPTLVIGGQR